MNEENAKIVFHITGGNNQILPRATHAEQHFYGDRFAPGHQASASPAGPTLPDIATRLAIYVPQEADRTRFIQLLAACRTASDVGRVAVQMVQQVPGLTPDDVKTQDFITLLQALSTGVDRGTGVSNFRKAIDNAYFSRKD